MTQLDQLQGAWRRSLIEWPNGDRDVTSRVLWLQGPSLYVDLRQSFELPSFEGVGALRDLRAPQIAALATQEGFAGVLVQHADCFEWTRQIDFQPKPIYSDRGTLDDRGDIMIERGCDVDYVEHWHRDEAVRSPRAAGLRLRDRADGRLAIIVRVGDVFMFARGRGETLDESRHLLEYVKDTRSLSEAQDLVDCELSLGVVDTSWRVRRSTLPFRVGASLALTLQNGSIVTADLTPAGRPIERMWQILDLEGSLDDFVRAGDAALVDGG